MKKFLLSLALVATAFVVSSQTLITVTRTYYYDQNGSRFPVTTGTVMIAKDNISTVESSGSGSILMLRQPCKMGSATVTGFSVTSTPDQISTAASSTASAFSLANGSVGAPTGAWASEAASGWYRIGANNYGFSVNGTKTFEFAAAGASLYGITTTTNLTATAGTITTLSSTTGGISALTSTTSTTGTLTTTGTAINGGTPQTLTGAGAVNLTAYSTLIVSTGADAGTLAAGAEGQHKFIRMKTDGGDHTLTVTNLQGGTTITFNDAGDFVELFYLDAKWHIIVNSGCAVA